MELRQYFLLLWKWLWLIVLSTIVAATLSSVATSRQPKMYQSSTKLIVGQSIQSTNPSAIDLQISQNLAQTYIQIADTTPVLQGVIAALGLSVSPSALRERMDARAVLGTQLIELRVDDIDPVRAQALAQEWANQLRLQVPSAKQDTQQRDFIQKQIDDLQRKITDAEKANAELQDSIQVMLSAREIAAKQQQIATNDNQINQWRQTLTSLLQYSGSASPNYISIIEPAQLPDTPYSPNVGLNVALAATIGLILSLGAVVLIEYLDDTLKSSDDVGQVLDLPVLSTVGVIEGEQNEKLVTMHAPRSPMSEAYRVLRTNVQFNGVDKPLKSVLVTSANRAEGKSLVTANLAVVMAQAGLRTILVDADLRKPYQHHLFNLSNHVGLTNGLMSPSATEGIVHATQVENLRILTTGGLPPNPAELLGSERMRTLKAKLEEQADILVFDSPPCLPVTDTAILARLVDGVVLVVDATRTPRKTAQHAKDILLNTGVRVLGVVLNRADIRGIDYDYRHDYVSGSTQGDEMHKSNSRKQFSILTRWLDTLVHR